MNPLIMKTRERLVQGCKLSQTRQKLHNTYNLLVEGKSVRVLVLLTVSEPTWSPAVVRFQFLL